MLCGPGGGKGRVEREASGERNSDDGRMMDGEKISLWVDGRMDLRGERTWAGMYDHARLRVDLAGPSPDGFPERASQLGRKPRCALKSAGAQITSPSPRPIRSSSHQGLGEPMITGPGWEHIAITRGINQIKLIPVVILQAQEHHLTRFGPRALPALAGF